MATKPELIRQVNQKDQHIRQLLDIVERLSKEPTTTALEPVNQFPDDFVRESSLIAPTPMVASWDDDDDLDDEDEFPFIDLLASLQPPSVPYGDEAAVAVGAIVLMLENRIDFLPIKTGADLNEYAGQAEVVGKLRIWLSEVVTSADGSELTDEAEADFWAEATALYEDLTS